MHDKKNHYYSRVINLKMIKLKLFQMIKILGFEDFYCTLFSEECNTIIRLDARYVTHWS